MNHKFLQPPQKFPFRCPLCEGSGSVAKEFSIEADVCPVCEGKRVIWGPPEENRGFLIKKSYREKFDELAKLEPGWDHPTDRSIDPKCIDLAKRVFDALVSVGCEEPHPTPTGEGGVELSWHDDEGWYLVIEIRPNKKYHIGAVYCPNVK